MTASACCVQRCAPVRFVRSTASQSSAFMRTARPSRVMAALFTRMSSLPNFSRAWRNPAFTCSASATSICTASASPPAAAISATTPASFSALRAAATTRAPACASASAVARPIPCDAPVTSATRSFRLNMITGAQAAASQDASVSASPPLRLRQSFERRAQGLLIFDVEHVHRAVDLPQQAAEHAAGADFDKRVDALLDQFAHGFFPAHGQASPGGSTLRAPPRRW